jgi:hypothetical protein
LAAIFSASPEDAIREFREELNSLLNRTLTDQRLIAISTMRGTLLGFYQQRMHRCANVGRGYHLYVGQTIESVERERGKFQVRTLAYQYRITEGPDFDAPYILRWEYNARELRDSFHPRHHFQAPVKRSLADGRALDFEKLHVSTGWVTIEEVIRFLISELEVKPKSADWDKILRESEERFRQRTLRSI